MIVKPFIADYNYSQTQDIFNHIGDARTKARNGIKDPVHLKMHITTCPIFDGNQY